MAGQLNVFSTNHSARARRALQLSAGLGALAFASIAFPQSAFAQNECGAPTTATVTCTSAGNNYPNGITYVAPPQDLTIVLNPDVVVQPTPGSFNLGVLAIADATHSITVSANTGASITTVDPGSFGVLAGTTAGNATVNTSSVSTSGNSAIGILAVADTGNVVVSTGTAYTKGAGAHGIAAYTGRGSITASAFTIVTSGAGADGMNLTTQGGNINVTLARGIFGGTVITNGNNSIGVLAAATGAGSVSIVGNGPTGFGPSAVVTAGAGATGVLATAQGGNVLVNLSQVQTTGLGADAIVATSTAGNVNVTAQTVTANNGRGVVATGATGASVTQSGNFIGTGGDNNAAVLISTTGGTASATIGTAFTGGANANAVDVTSANGNVVAAIGGASTQGSGSVGVRIGGNTTAVATVGSVRTYGNNAIGVVARGNAGTASVTNNGNVQTAGLNSNGIDISGNGGVSVSGTGSVSTTGVNAVAINANSAGAVSITDSGAISTTGSASNGVTALSTGNLATVTTGAVSTTGANAVAISAQGTSASVTANGTVSRIGALGASPAVAISVQGTTGSATASVGSVTGSGAGMSAVLAQGATTAAVTVRAGGVINGNVDGVDVTSATGSTVSNAGTIYTGTGYAIRATGGGAATITNTGTINGRLLLTAGNDSVTNNGTFNASQVSNFGTGSDSFTNNGTFNAATGGGLTFGGTGRFTNGGTFAVLPNTGTAGTFAITGLTSFTNSGTIDLRNGHTGDVLNLGASTFTGSGASTLALDVQLGGATPSADRLVVGAAGGSTSIVLNNLTTGIPLLNPGVIVVQGGAGSTAGAFTLANGSTTYGFASYGLSFNATNNSYSLVGAPSQEAYRTLDVAEGARALWYKSADAWSAHMVSLRDATWRATEDPTISPGSGLWMQMFGSSNTRGNDIQAATTFGMTTVNDLGYKQDAFGGQIGFDFGAPKPRGGLVFGITGGYLNSTMEFGNSVDRITYNSVNGGAYASYVSGMFFANVLGKYDYSWIDSRLAGNGNRLHGDSYGAQGEVGIRFGSTRFFVEPVAQIAYVRTDISTLVAPGFSFDFNEPDGLRGEAGARMGAAFDLHGSKGLFYVSGMAVHDFHGGDTVNVTSGGQTVGLTDPRIGTYGQGTVGFNVTTPGGITGFIEGFGDYGNDYRGGGGRVGLRVKF